MGTHPIFESDFDCLTAHMMFNKVISRIGPKIINPLRQNSRIDGLSTNLSVMAKSKDDAPISLDCIDLIQHPSADVALFEFDRMYSRVTERSTSEIDIYSEGEEGVTGQISVYSKVKVRAVNGKTTISSLEAPAVEVQSKRGDIELNGIKIANSILGEKVRLISEHGNIVMNKRTLGDVTCNTGGNITTGTIQSLKIDLSNPGFYFVLA